jgi:chemotaxis protein histidine kinase CheA
MVKPAMSSDRAAAAAEVFDQTLLKDYSMQNQELAGEILELFLVQLPTMLEALDTARSQTAWSFATHTLKGSAASIGARKLYHLAAELESMSYPGDGNVRALRLEAVKAAASDFRIAARQSYPQQR